MSEPLTMNQVIHGAVRRDLDRLATALEQLREGDRSRAQGLERAYTNLHVQLTHHHEGEDRHLFPVLPAFGVGAPLIAAMESEHQAMSDALAETATAMRALADRGSSTDAAAASESVVRTRSVVNGHLGHEEGELEPLLRRHLESPEWKAVEKKLSRQPPGVAGRFFAWLTDGMAEEHRASLEATVPTPVVIVLSRVFGRAYYRDVAPVWRSS